MSQPLPPHLDYRPPDADPQPPTFGRILAGICLIAGSIFSALVAAALAAGALLALFNATADERGPSVAAGLTTSAISILFMVVSFRMGRRQFKWRTRF